MFFSVVDFLMQLSLVYLLTVMFVILDLLILVRRAEERRSREAERDSRDMRRTAEQEQERKAYENRREYLQASPS